MYNPKGAVYPNKSLDFLSIRVVTVKIGIPRTILREIMFCQRQSAYTLGSL
jgi:hypothetical protein